MKEWFMSNLVWLIAIPLAFAIVAVVKRYWPGYKDDNKVEQVVEEVIKDNTGISLDLTPSSPEPEKK